MAVVAMLILLVLLVGTFGTKLVIFPVLWEQWRHQTPAQRARGLKYWAVFCAVTIPMAALWVIAPFGQDATFVWSMIVLIALAMSCGLGASIVAGRRAARRARQHREHALPFGTHRRPEGRLAGVVSPRNWALDTPGARRRRGVFGLEGSDVR
jgi:hypothetical protein